MQCRFDREIGTEILEISESNRDSNAERRETVTESKSERDRYRKREGEEGVRETQRHRERQTGRTQPPAINPPGSQIRRSGRARHSASSAGASSPQVVPCLQLMRLVCLNGRRRVRRRDAVQNPSRTSAANFRVRK